MKYKTKSLGFSLVEVMVAVLVLGVGILAVAKLQGTLIRNGSDANQRTVATSLAQKKIDDLRAFTNLNSTYTWSQALALSGNLPKTEVAYKHITGDTDLTTYTETGGLILPSASIRIDSVVYSLNWTVEDYWHTTALSMPTTAQPSPVPATSDFKTVTVTVGWSNETGQAQSISLDTIIDAYSPALTDLANNSQNGGKPPQVSYTPGTAPEIVNISLEGGSKRESTAPRISVSQNNQFVEYDFSIITYDADNNIEKQEDLRQINCVCEQQSTDAVTYLPATFELASDESTLIEKFDADSSDFKVVSGGKNWGARVSTGQYGQQSGNCDICCRDHHDKTGPTDPDTLFDPFRPTANYTAGDHNHYFPDNDGVLQLANDAGALYLEACTLTKIDGIFRVAQDLNLLTVKTMPETYLGGTGLSQYQSYKTDYLLAYAKQLDNHSSYPAQSIGYVSSSTSIKYLLNDPSSSSVVNLAGEPDLDNPGLSIGDTVNLRAKTLYARYIPTEVFTKLIGIIDPDTTWLEISHLLPFYDPDGTEIAQTNDDVSAWGTTEPSQINVNKSGILTALASTIDNTNGNASVEATRPDSTTGFTNSQQIDPHDASQSHLTSDEMLVVVDGSHSPTVVNVTLTVTVSVDAGVTDKNVLVDGQDGANCTPQPGQNKHVHNCSFPNGNGTLVISDYNHSYTINPSNIDVLVDNKVCLAFTEPTINVIDDGTLLETSSIIYSALPDPTGDKNIHIALGTGNCP